MEKPPIEIISLARHKFKKWYPNHKQKADIVICGNKNYGWSIKIKCEGCGKSCYYTPNESLDLKKKNIKKICMNCALTKYKNKLNEEQINMLRNVLGK